MPATGAADLTARAIIDASLYLVLATADGTGTADRCRGVTMCSSRRGDFVSELVEPQHEFLDLG